MSNEKALILSLALAAGLTAGAVARPAFAEETDIGKREFNDSCAGCHGLRGDGHGPIAHYLTVKPADLTVLAQKNKGDFPFLRIGKVIDGREEISVHGPREMPVWGARFKSEAAGSVNELAVRSRVYALAEYLQSLQKK